MAVTADQLKTFMLNEANSVDGLVGLANWQASSFDSDIDEVALYLGGLDFSSLEQENTPTYVQKMRTVARFVLWDKALKFLSLKAINVSADGASFSLAALYDRLAAWKKEAQVKMGEYGIMPEGSAGTMEFTTIRYQGNPYLRWPLSAGQNSYPQTFGDEWGNS